MFAPGLSGFDGLYGFAADSLRGNYQPLNDSGLVVANPADVPFRSYSWMVYEHQDELLVQSFLNYEDIAAESLEVVEELSADEQRTRFTGTLGPTLRLGLDGHHTSLQGVLDHWHLPGPADPLPSSTDSKSQNR
ncbi:MAG: Levansucrase/Invertase [uncultured archaeon A07HR60]|nr:MAG: Levansucrase/Invertase [uncultured archaeon A07HR60]